MHNQYYRLWDLQCTRYLSTGYNAYGIEDLREQFLSYISVDYDSSDPDDVHDFEVWRTCEPDALISRIQLKEFVVETSNVMFEEEHEGVYA
jgi:hypothetical protein